jgi:hypothetical protein
MNSHRPRAAVADRTTVPHRLAALLATALLVLGVFATPPALAQNGGRDGGPSLPQGKLLGESLTYDSFTAFNCSQSGFTTSTVVHLDIAGHVFVEGTTFLDGAPYDTYTADLGFGPDTFVSSDGFGRVFSPPPPTSSTYTFVFRSRAIRDGVAIGTSVTTITCANGVFSAVNAWEPAGTPIPAGTPAAWAALALLLAAAAAARLRSRRA